MTVTAFDDTGSELTRLSGSISVFRVLNNTITAVRGGFSFDEAGNVTYGLTLSGVTTPGVQEVFGGLDVTLFTDDGFTIDVLPVPLALNVSVNYFASYAATLTDSRVLADTSLLVEFSTHNPIPPRGSVRIALPDGFKLRATATVTQKAPSDGTTGLPYGGVGMDGDLTLVVLNASSGEIRLDRAGLTATPAGGSHALLIDGVVTPPYEQTVTQQLAISTHDAPGGRYIDVLAQLGDVRELGLDSAKFMSTLLEVIPNDLSDASAHLDDDRAGATTDGYVTFRLRNPLPVGGAVELTFPLGFNVTAAPVATLAVLRGGAEVPLPALVGANTSVDPTLAPGESRKQLTLRLDADAPPTAYGEALILRFYNVTAPCWRQQTPSFDLRTAVPTDETVDTLRSDVTLAISANVITTAAVTLAEPTTGALTSADVSFVVHNAVPSGGAVKIAFPAGFSFFGPATGMAFAGSVEASSQALGSPLDVVLGGGDAAEMADDHVVVVWRDRDAAYENDTCFDAGASPVGEVRISLSNVRVPLQDGPAGPFNITTLTASGADIDVLQVYVDVDVGWGRFAPSPPPPGASSAPAMRGGGGGGAGALVATGVAVASALLLHRRRTVAL